MIVCQKEIYIYIYIYSFTWIALIFFVPPVYVCVVVVVVVVLLYLPYMAWLEPTPWQTSICQIQEYHTRGQGMVQSLTFVVLEEYVRCLLA